MQFLPPRSLPHWILNLLCVAGSNASFLDTTSLSAKIESPSPDKVPLDFTYFFLRRVDFFSNSFSRYPISFYFTEVSRFWSKFLLAAWEWKQTGPERIVQGTAQKLPAGEKTRGQRVADHLEGPSRHYPRRLAQGAGHTQELDQALVRPQTWAATIVQVAQNQGQSRLESKFT
jgi:hypothetical protein